VSTWGGILGEKEESEEDAVLWITPCSFRRSLAYVYIPFESFLEPAVFGEGMVT
jgi:hypothetical protein